MAAKKNDDVKKTEAVVEAPAAEVKEAVAEVKETVKRAVGRPAKKAAPAAKKAAATAKKAASATKKAAATAAKKTTAAAKKAAAKVPAKEKDQVVLEFAGKSISVDEIVAAVKKAYKADGNKGAIKKVQIYVKPEENEAYYVINDVAEGKKIDL